MSESYIKITAGGILLLGFFLLFFSNDSNQNDSSDVNINRIPSSMLTKEYTEKAREHLFKTHGEIQYQEFKNKDEVLNNAPALRSTHEQVDVNAHRGFDLSSEDTSKRLAEDLNRSNNQDVIVAETPDQLIQSQLFSQDQLRQYSEAYKAEYMRQFIENARRGGYDIEIDDSYKIVSIKKLGRGTSSRGNSGTMNQFAPVR